ncbi:DNA alkylation repair protein [Brevibacterium sediminis]|uniref:DNA alkylation repair protein n=1 Tax=Brevibacterium sediminis TaxID=1857024 RepID=A0A5C4X4P4_9MICO|nr:DNA alkylation repair protein [Brevibacterium sediminis]TNM55843.1 DNA alkylation repair protein [Brevibacterium sediminis]
MNSDSRNKAHTLAEAVDRDLRARGGSERAQKERAYLKSELLHYGVSVPDTRAVVRAALRTVKLYHEEVIELARLLWAAPTSSDDSAGSAEPTHTGAGSAGHPTPVHERRAAATMVLIQSKDRLGGADADFIEGLLREAKTWALVDPLAGDLVGPLSERDAAFDPVLERWASDEDLWIRRSALLAHLIPLRHGRGDFDRFSRFADAMLEEKEFFIRKAIGWVLRDTSRKRPDLVFDWILPRAHRASGVTIREAVKRLSTEQREAVLASR